MKLSRIFILDKLMALLLCAFCACAPATNKITSVSEAQRNFIDEIGRSVSIPSAPKRIISLAPNLTETLFALGLGDRVVGVTSYCDYPAEARAKEKVGDTLKPNLERLIALKPDLVLVTTSSQLENLMRQLDQLKIPMYVSNPRTVRDVIASIRKLGEVTGTEDRARKLADEMEQRLSKVKQQVAGQHQPRVLYVLQNSPLITAGRGTFINDLIMLAGAESISGNETADYPQFSRETVIARAPEIIVIPESHGTELVNEEAVRRDYAETPAVRNNRVVKINPDLIDRPGPRIIEGLEALAQALHPTKQQSQ
ncbi:MAG TPA: cobalamin-binding protein [Blastocatellia bacterium]|nr:cobalamin-binding protein [Blastocatellia bacterium]